MRHRRARDIIRTPQVGIDQLVKVRIRRLRNGQRSGINARAVKDAVKPAVGLERVRHGAITLCAGAHVAGECGVRGSVFGKVLEEGAETFLVDIA